MRPRAALIFIGGFAAALGWSATPGARALPPPAPPRAAPSSSPSSAPPASVLPYGAQLLFVLDDNIDSGTTVPGTTIHMHLKGPLVVNGITVAPAGSPATLAVITTRKAHSGDEDGAIQIHLDPLPLRGYEMSLPIRAYHEYLTIEYTAGQESTRSVSDTIADIFIPGHIIYHALRPGRQMVLPAGSILRTQTAATIDARNAAHLVLATPPPFVSSFDPPHADLTAAPLYTPAPERPRPLPRGKPTLPPSPSATPSEPPATPSESPATLPAATGSAAVPATP